MRKKRVLCFSLWVFLCHSFGWGRQSSMTSLLKSKELRISEVVSISDDSLPEGVVLEIPVSVSLHSSGNVYVCDGTAADIKVFDGLGKFSGTIGRKGQGPGEFSARSLVHVSEHALLVWDRSTRKLSLFTLGGRFLKSLEFIQARDGYPMQMRSLPDGRFVIETERINEQSRRFPQECLIGLYSSKLEFIKKLYARPVYRYKRIFDPGYAEVHQPYNPRVYWDVIPTGRLVIGCSDRYEIEIHDPDKGKLKIFSGKYTPVRVVEEDQRDYFSQMTVSFVLKSGLRTTKRGAPSYIVDNTSFPKYKPAFDSLRTDSDGNIWIHVYREGRDSEKRTFDGFSRDGEYIGQVKILPPGEYPSTGTTIIDGFFWMIEKDGTNKITKYQIAKSHMRDVPEGV